MAQEPTPSTPEGIFSLLDTDLYKLTMQNAVLKHFPQAVVGYQFTNRTPHMRLTRPAFDWLQQQVSKLSNIALTSDELQWLRKTCPYLKENYLHFLENFRFQPAKHVALIFTPTPSSSTNDETPDTIPGDLAITVNGRWVDTILYEIPLLALTSEAYFKFVDRNWDHTAQQTRAFDKASQLLHAGCAFSEYGSRRRRDYTTHEMVMRGLTDAARTHASLPGRFMGTSNVHFAHRFGVSPVGTVAHEWFMGIAALNDDYAGANATALRLWLDTYGPGVLGIALTDTFGTPAFLRTFAQPAPAPNGPKTYAQHFAGVRQDSGDPLAFVKTIHAFYAEHDLLKENKLVVFSDSLNIDRCIEYKRAADEAGLVPSFGIGTFFTNDFRQISSTEGEQDPPKSVPLNIVIKLSSAEGRPAIKLSDDKGKNMGDDKLMRDVKNAVKYEDHVWEGGDEAHRWDR